MAACVESSVVAPISSAAAAVAAPAAAAGTVVPVLERRAVTVRNRVQCKQDQVVSWLQDFYSAPGNLEKLLPILQGSSAVSLRLVDYFVTNYAKKTNAAFVLGGKHFLVYFNYKRELNAYSKRLFDPFCRRERIMFQARGMEPFVTTVGQLNFFRWFIEKNILEYVMENHATIETDMNRTLKEHYSRSNTTVTSKATSVASASTTRCSVATGAGAGATSSGPASIATTVTDDSLLEVVEGEESKVRKKRCELTQSAMKKVNVHECDAVVSFL
jgi:hypothetical protein